MLTRREVRRFLDAVFREATLAVAGLMATEGLADEVVWRLVGSLDAIRTKALRRLQSSAARGRDDKTDIPDGLTPHPAIEDFLQRLDREQAG